MTKANKQMNVPLTNKTLRIDSIDALRGFAIMSIMLLHNLEHFDFYYMPQNYPIWLTSLDSKIWNTMFFLFSGKSYAIFALLFGFTFHIQSNSENQLGVDFRIRFLWRLLLLLGFGIINSVFYQGDILAMYAIIGVVLVMVCKMNNRALFILAIFFLLQPIEWAIFFYELFNPDFVIPLNTSGSYFEIAHSYLSNDSFFVLAKGNLTNGRKAVFLWSWENGRFFQAIALFILGMLSGRLKLFVPLDENLKRWNKILILAAIIFILLYTLNYFINYLGITESLVSRLNRIIKSWSNIAFMSILVSGFILMYDKPKVNRILNVFKPFGRMSLSNYILQSIIGSFIYYGYGLGLYKYTGATVCLLIGIVLFAIQLLFCRWWLLNHKQGPLEYLWHQATWFGKKSKLSSNNNDII